MSLAPIVPAAAIGQSPDVVGTISNLGPGETDSQPATVVLFFFLLVSPFSLYLVSRRPLRSGRERAVDIGMYNCDCFSHRIDGRTVSGTKSPISDFSSMDEESEILGCRHGRAMADSVGSSLETVRPSFHRGITTPVKVVEKLKSRHVSSAMGEERPESPQDPKSDGLN